MATLVDTTLTGLSAFLLIVLFWIVFRAAVLRAAESRKGSAVVALFGLAGLALLLLGAMSGSEAASVCGLPLLVLFLLAVVVLVLHRRRDRGREDREV